MEVQLLILLFIFSIPNSSCLFSDAFEAGTLLRNVITQLNEENGLSVTVRNLKTIFFHEPENDSPEIQIFRHESNGAYETLTLELQPFLTFVNDSLRTMVIFDDGMRVVRPIQIIDELFVSYLRQFEYSEQHPGKSADLKQYALSKAATAQYHLSRLRSKLTSQEENSWNNVLLSILLHIVIDRKNHNCGDAENAKNNLINMHRIILATEIKVYLLQAIATTHELGYVSSQHQEMWLADLNEYLIIYAKSFSTLMERIAPSHFRFCDVQYNNWMRDVSTIELHEFVREKIFSYRHVGCTSTCHDMWLNDECSKSLSKSNICDGDFTNLSKIKIRNGCGLRGSRPRYHWILHENGYYLGEGNEYCPKVRGYRFLTQEESLSGNYSFCRGQCVRDIWGIHLGLMKSRESRNYVIVGMRLIVKNKVLFLQPAEGLLGSDGKISNFSWISIPKVIADKKIARVNLTWHSFFLDDLELASTYVLTGIRFNRVKKKNNGEIKGFAISIRGRLLDFRTGKLNLTSIPKYVRNFSSAAQKELPLTLVTPPPHEIFQRLKPSLREYTYVKLQQSDFIADVGQSTLPLFDSTPVILKQHSALSGIGIFHKGSKDHAGFISLRLHPISYVQYFQTFIKANATRKRNTTLCNEIGYKDFPTDFWALVKRTRAMIKLIGNIDTTYSAGIEFDKSVIDPNDGNHLAQEFNSIFNELQSGYSRLHAGKRPRVVLIQLMNHTGIDQREEIIESMIELNQHYQRFSSIVRAILDYHLSEKGLFSKPLFSLGWLHSETEEDLHRMRELVMSINNDSSLNYGPFSAMTASTINTKNDKCDVEALAVPLINFYQVLVFYEMRALLLSAFARGYVSARFRVAQPKTPDISMDFHNQFIIYSKAFSASWKAVISSISKNCISECPSLNQGQSILSAFAIDAAELAAL